MGNGIILSRAPGPGPMTVDGVVWDQLAAYVEWVGGIVGGNAVAKHDRASGPVFTSTVILSKLVLLQIQTSITGVGAGWYNAKLWLPPSTAPDVTAALTAAVLGTAGDDCYYGNLTESGKTTHDLVNAANTGDKLYVGFPWGAASDGKRIYLGNGFFLEDCS